MLATAYTLSETTTAAVRGRRRASARASSCSEGFGVLCEIDVQATLEEKLDVEREPYMILGACNPAARAPGARSRSRSSGTLLPCNVVVYRDGDETHIAAIDAERMLSIVGNDKLAPVAIEVKERLANVVRRAAVKTGGS